MLARSSDYNIGRGRAGGFLFKKVSAEDFDAAVDQLHEEIPNLKAHEIRVGFARIVSLFKYGHTQIPYNVTAQTGILPVNLYHFKDGVYIEGVEKLHKKTLGAKVLKIGEVPIEKALELIHPVVPAENAQYFKAYGLRFLISPEVLHAQRVIPQLSDTVTMTLEKEGTIFNYTFPTIAINDKPKAFNFTLPTENWLTARQAVTTPLYLKHFKDKSYYFAYLDATETLYVRQSSVFNDAHESLEQFYKRLFEFIDTHQISKLIYDVRLNGGGDNSNNLTLIKGLMARPKVNAKGKFFFIIGRDTFSACQNLTNEITKYTEAILVGEPTSENVNFYGDARPIELPNSKINAYLSFAWWQDRPQWDDSEATLPHIAIDMTFEQYVTNQDPVLEAALNHTNDGFILNPLEHLNELFLAGRYEELKNDAALIAKNDQYRYYNFEEEFGKAGGNLLQHGNLEGAIFIFELLTELYQESAGHYYNLGSTLEQAQQKDKAVIIYKTLIKRMPEHVLARSAKNRIESLMKE